MVGRVAKPVLISFVVFLAVGNLLILAMSAWARSGMGTSGGVAGVKNFRVVDDHLWRGAAPNPAGYEWLAERGVRTIVDLRAEDGIEIPQQMLGDAGIRWVHLPIRDGQTPSQDQVRRFLAAVDASDGPVFVHCGAGVGRTGAIVAAYLAETGQADGAQRVFENLAVGPPSLEQIVYAAGTGADLAKPNVAVVLASRVLDGPRRILHRLGI